MVRTVLQHWLSQRLLAMNRLKSHPRFELRRIPFPRNLAYKSVLFQVRL